MVHSHGNLANYTAYSSNSLDFIALWPADQDICFFPDTRQQYSVYLSYKPDIKLAGYQGFIYFQSGGAK